MYERSDDLVIALQQATELMEHRFADIACATSDTEAAQRITAVADIFVAWLRRPVSISLGTPTIEEQELS